MTYLVDTNVISELRKGVRCDPNVAAWYAGVAETGLFLSVLVIGEIRSGIERLRRRDRPQAAAIASWLAAITRDFEDRILPIDRAVAEVWGRNNARRPIAAVDGLIAATARVHGLIVVTRNVADFARTGCPLLNPFEARAK